jgi:hypothetical protein
METFVYLSLFHTNDCPGRISTVAITVSTDSLFLIRHISTASIQEFAMNIIINITIGFILNPNYKPTRRMPSWSYLTEVSLMGNGTKA